MGETVPLVGFIWNIREYLFSIQFQAFYRHISPVCEASICWVLIRLEIPVFIILQNTIFCCFWVYTTFVWPKISILSFRSHWFHPPTSESLWFKFIIFSPVCLLKDLKDPWADKVIIATLNVSSFEMFSN